jgi:hypothetical protein
VLLRTESPILKCYCAGSWTVESAEPDGPAGIGTSAPGHGGLVKGFNGLMPSAQGTGAAVVVSGTRASVEDVDADAGTSAMGCAGAGAIGETSGTDPIVEGPEDTVARLVTAPLAGIGVHLSRPPVRRTFP